MALFGYDSFITTRLSHQETFIRDYDSWPRAEDADTGQWVGYTCVDQKPLSSLLLEPSEASSFDCITDNVQSLEKLDEDLAFYVRSFYPASNRTAPFASGTTYERLENAFTSAVVLATEAWLTLDSESSSPSREVYSDPGVDTVIPAISREGMIAISSLWAVYIACLTFLALYSARTPRWTNRLDAFAMMCIGAATHEQISLDVGFVTKDIHGLDEMPGYVGDATGGKGDVGALGMGATTPLNGVRRYRCYRADELEALRKAEERAEEQIPYYLREPTYVERNGKIYKIKDLKKSGQWESPDGA